MYNKLLKIISFSTPSFISAKEFFVFHWRLQMIPENLTFFILQGICMLISLQYPYAHRKAIRTLFFVLSIFSCLGYAWMRCLSVACISRVTRLGEFSPVEWFLKIIEVVHFLGLLFPRLQFCFNFDKRWVRLPLGHFFQKLIWSPCLLGNTLKWWLLSVLCFRVYVHSTCRWIGCFPWGRNQWKAMMRKCLWPYAFLW
jgi:hypothetical protein